MARKPDPAASSESSDRDKIIAAFMALLAERRYEDIGFGDIAARAGVPLHRCRAEFDSQIAVLAAQMREIDRKVLAADDADMAEESPRERLFDVLMRRLEALGPYKAALRSLARSARCNPVLALAINGLTARSQACMLSAAGIDNSGLRGAIRAQGLACLYADTMRAWLDDEDPGLARTMAALDRALARGARWSRGLDDLCRLATAPCRISRSRRERHTSDPGEQPAVV